MSNDQQEQMQFQMATHDAVSNLQAQVAEMRDQIIRQGEAIAALEARLGGGMHMSPNGYPQV